MYFQLIKFILFWQVNASYLLKESGTHDLGSGDGTFLWVRHTWRLNYGSNNVQVSIVLLTKVFVYAWNTVCIDIFLDYNVTWSDTAARIIYGYPDDQSHNFQKCSRVS